MSISVNPVVLRTGESGIYIAECARIAGCYSRGETVEEARQNIREPIELRLGVMRERGECLSMFLERKP